MNVLIYNASYLRYEIPVKPMSDLDKERVCLIEDINKIQIALHKGPLTPADFDRLWADEIDVLRNAVYDQSVILNTAKYAERKASS